MSVSNIKKFLELKPEMITKFELLIDEGIYKLTFKYKENRYVELTFDINESTLGSVNFKQIMDQKYYKHIEYIDDD